MNILLLGATGLLGNTLSKYLRSKDYNISEHGRSTRAEFNANISKKNETNTLLDLTRPDVIINLIGLTDVDFCEANPNQAYLVNVRTVENICDWISNNKNDCHLIHISSDQVYDGSGIHTEDEVNLSNYYAFSKYAGEIAARGVHSCILRTNFFGFSHCNGKESLTDWIYQSINNGRKLSVFDNVLFSPLSMITLSKMIALAIDQRMTGTFNLGSHSGMSKADFSFLFAKETKLAEENMSRISIEQAGFIKTYRPKDMRLDISRFEDTFSIKLPTLENEIIEVAREYNEHV